MGKQPNILVVDDERTIREVVRRYLELEDKILLRKRAVIESVNNLLKNWANIAHTRHRSPNNFFVNLMAGLIAYCWKPEKPSVAIDEQEIMLLDHQPRLA